MRKLYLYFTLLLTCLTYLAQSQMVAIGTGTSATLTTGQTATSLQSPYNSYYGYSYVQTLYLQSEINASGNITSISYYFTGSSLANSDGVKIYMGVVNRSAFTSTTDWEPLSNLTLVYDGTISGTVPGWVTITLSTPFAYNNTGNLLIAIDENTAGDSGSSGYRASNLGSNRVIFYRDDATNPDPATPPTAGGRSSFVGNIQINGLTLQGCQPATGINISALAPTSATAGWTAPAGGSAVVQYNWELRTSGAAGSGAAGLTASGNSATTSVNLSSLAANTAYSFYLRTDCGSSSYSAWSTATAFTTPCNPLTTLPLLETFENAALPACWSTQVTSGTVNWTIGTTSAGGDIGTPFSGTRFISKAYTTSTANLISPPMNLASLGTNQARISAYVYRHAATVAADVINFYVNTAPNTTGATNLMAIHPLTTVAPTAPAAGWYKYTADIPTSFNSSGVIYFIVEGITTAGFSSYDLAIEDFLIEPIPSCEAPTGLSFSNISSTEADINWNAPASGSAPIDYQIYYSTSNTAPTAGSTPNITGANPPSTISALTPNTTYYVWVRTNCGPTDKSSWSSVASFTTLCSTVTSFTENFDALTVPALPSCWRKVSTTGLASTQTTSPNSSPNTMYIYGGSSADMSVVSLTPVSNLDAGTHRLKFKARANFTVGGVIEVGYLTNPSDASSFTLIQSTTASALTYQDYEVVPSGIPPGNTVLAFRHTGSPAYSVLIDDVKWEVIPTCDVPSAISVSNVTVNGADVTWTAPGVSSPIDYQIYYNTSGTAPTGATVPTVTGASSPASLSGLAANTLYYIWVRSNCGGPDVSAWVSGGTFTTLCNATNVPYSQDFESATVPNLPSCTSRENAGTGNNWTVAANPGNGFTSNTLQYAYSGANAANAWFYTQGINLTSGTSYRISYRYGNNSTTYVEKLEVKYGNAANNASMTDLIANHASINTGTATSVSYDFTPSATGVYYFGFHAYSIANQFNLYVDDISVIVTPTCEVPTTIAAANITTTGADISWADPTTGNPPVNYQLYYSTSSTAPTGATVPTVSGVVGTSTTLSGLSHSSLYYLWIRTNCGSGTFSAWTPVAFTFATLCNSATIPTASQSFDAVAMPVCWTTATVTGTVNWAPDTDNDGVPSAHSGARFMGKDYTASDALTFSQPINMTTAGASGARINVWIYRNTVNKANDRIRFHINQTQSLAGATQLLEIFPLISVAPTVASAGWYNYTVNIPASYNTETTVYIIAQGTTDGTFASYGIGFDDFYVEPIPSCNEPTNVIVSNVTTTGAKVDWSVPAAGSPVNYQAYYSTTNTAPTGATVPSATGLTGTTTNLSGLAPATTYYLWMRTFCGGSNYSPWTPGAIVFTTPCTAVAVPYTENFESATVPNLPACTSKENAGTGDQWEVTSNPGNGFTSKTLLYNYNSSNDANAWFYTRPLNLTGGTTYTLTFRYGNNSASYVESLKVMYGTAAANASMTNAIVDYPAITGGAPSTSSTNFTPSATGVYVIGFNVYSISNQWNLYVDDIALSATTLPVSLTDFRGEKIGEMNRLSWTTATETNNRGFELQRSADGKEFSALTFVATKAANGNSTSSLSYGFDDERPISGTNYYRLKQVDKDGKFAYSNIVVLKSKISDIRFTSVYPNPATKELKMVISSPSAEKVTFIVTDITGKVLMQQNTQLVMGDNQSMLNVQKLAAGTYFIKAVCANGCETATMRFVKQ